MKKGYKGFTLIELLVVIAIIGILASVVLASLNSARSKGQAASIKANMKNIQSQGALYYDTNNFYATSTLSTCSGGLFSDANVTAAITQASSTGAAMTCNATSGTSGAFAISASSTALGGSFCIDSAGQAKASSTAVSGVCN